MDTEEERRARLENDATIRRLRLAMEMDKKSKTGEDGSYGIAHLIKRVVNVGVVLSLKPILKSWQLCSSFKLDVLTT